MVHEPAVYGPIHFRSTRLCHILPLQASLHKHGPKPPNQAERNRKGNPTESNRSKQWRSVTLEAVCYDTHASSHEHQKTPGLLAGEGGSSVHRVVHTFNMPFPGYNLIPSSWSVEQQSGISMIAHHKHSAGQRTPPHRASPETAALESLGLCNRPGASWHASHARSAPSHA